MLDFDDIEDIFAHRFTYLTGILLQAKRDRTVESEPQTEYLKYCIREVKAVVLECHRKWVEDEQEWGVLKHYITEIKSLSEITTDPKEIAKLIWKLYIILDRAFILKYEGLPLHCNPLL